MNLGSNIRWRRRKLKMSQQELAKGDWTRSYISQVESGKIRPSYDTLIRLAQKLDTTASDLIGDGLQIRKAKALLLHGNHRLDLLSDLPKTSTTTILEQIADSLQSNTTVDCQLPPNAELYSLTARVLIFQGNYQQAEEILTVGLKFVDEFWRILFLSQLAQLYGKLDQPEKQEEIKERLADSLEDIDSLKDLTNKVVADLRVEVDPVRTNDLLNLLNAIDFHSQFDRLLREQ